jgi:hypothetical protein
MMVKTKLLVSDVNQTLVFSVARKIKIVQNMFFFLCKEITVLRRVLDLKEEK